MSSAKTSVNSVEDHAALLQENHELRKCLEELLLIRHMQVKHTFNPGYELRVNKAWGMAEELMGVPDAKTNS